ncbi:MAG: hypothetical protein IIY90_06365 [Oscillospiraceae bacterium]|nr:hypothetical protein [Oscillospiraceae bacterium]
MPGFPISSSLPPSDPSNPFFNCPGICPCSFDKDPRQMPGQKIILLLKEPIPYPSDKCLYHFYYQSRYNSDDYHLSYTHTQALLSCFSELIWLKKFFVFKKHHFSSSDDQYDENTLPPKTQAQKLCVTFFKNKVAKNNFCLQDLSFLG